MKILIPSIKGARMVDTEDIIYCEANEQHTRIYLDSLIHKPNKYFSSTNSLKNIEDISSKICFFRCHKSYLINFAHFFEFDVKTHSIIMTNAHSIQISRRKKSEAKKNLLKYIKYYNSKN